MRKRRREGKTDYRARISLLKGGKARVVFRKTNKYIVGQYVKSKEAKDYVVVGVSSKELLQYGWPKNALGSLKSIPASYFTGLLLGKKISEKEGEKAEGILDIGLLRSIQKSRAYAFLKGVIDAGIKIKYKEDLFPDEGRIKGKNIKISLEFGKIKQNIENKPLREAKIPKEK